MKKISLLFFFLAFNSILFAQGIMNFPTETYDFGSIEEGTMATYEFEFTNTGDQFIEVSQVKASCGCTAPSWTKEQIFPGKKGKIKASFDSNGRPGPFLKSLTVTSNAKKQTLILYIKGFVKGKETNQGAKFVETPQQEAAPAALQLDMYSFDYGKVEAGEKPKQRINIHNSGGSPLIIKSLDSKCKCVAFGLSNGIIGAGQTEVLELTLNADKIQKLEEIFTLQTNDPANPTKEIVIKAEIYENFSKSMFKEKKKAAPFE